MSPGCGRALAAAKRSFVPSPRPTRSIWPRRPRDEALRPAAPRSRRPERPGSGGAGAAAAGAARPAGRTNAALRGRPPAGPGRRSLRFRPRAHRARSRHLSRGVERGSASAQLLAPRPRQRQSGRRALMNIYSERRRAPPPPPRPPIAPVWAVRAEPTPARLKVERPLGPGAACPARPFRCGNVVLFAGCLPSGKARFCSVKCFCSLRALSSAGEPGGAGDRQRGALRRRPLSDLRAPHAPRPGSAPTSCLGLALLKRSVAAVGVTGISTRQ